MYAMLCTRPDINHAKSVVSRFQSDLGSEHRTTVKHIFKYLKRTRHHCLVFGSEIWLLKDMPIQIFNLILMIENQLLDLCSLLERVL